jgi:hypothetical protein
MLAVNRSLLEWGYNLMNARKALASILRKGVLMVEFMQQGTIIM